MGAGERAADWPLMGRDREYATLRALTRRGKPGAVIAGPAGVGKSRLLRELAAAGPSLFVAGSRTTAAIPLGAFASVLPARPDQAPLEGDLLRWAADAVRSRDPRPDLLAVDDGHALDDASAALVGVLAASGTTVAVTVRSGETAPDAVTALWKDGGVERIEVGPLAIDDVDGLLVAVLGGPLEGRARHELWQASHGNPLYLRELVLGALDRGLLASEAGIWRLTRSLTASPRLHELVEARLGDIDEDDRTTVDLLAVGEPMPLPLLLALVPVASVERLEARGHVVVAPDGIRFAHPLHGEVVRQGLPALRTMAISRRLCEAVDRAADDGAAGIAVDPLRLARWRLDGGGTADPAVLVSAATAAFAAHDQELADRLADAAVAAGGGVPARIVRVQVLGALGRPDEQAELFPDLLADAGDDTERAMIANTWAESLFWDHGQAARADEVLAGVIPLLDPGGWQQKIQIQRSTFALLSGDVDRALDGAARYLGPDAGRIANVNAYMIAILALAYQGRGQLARTLARAGLDLHDGGEAEQVGTHPAMVRIAAVAAHAEAADLDEACALAAEGYRRAVAAGGANNQAWAALVHGTALVMMGRARSADRWFREAIAVFAAIGRSTIPQRRSALAGRIIGAALSGDDRQCRALVAELDALPTHTVRIFEPEVLRARGWAAWSAGDRGAATAYLSGAVALSAAFGTVNFGASALHDAVRLGLADPVAVAPALAAVTADGRDGSGDDMAAIRADHVAALAGGDAGALLAVSERCQDHGLVLLAAEAAAAASGVLRRAGDRRAADTAARRARALADGCEGARPLGIDQAGEGATLTAREREVAELAAAGRTSKAIAAELAVSSRTVDNLLARAYQKLGIAGRSELAEALDPLGDRPGSGP